MTPQITYTIGGFVIREEVRMLSAEEAGEILATKNTRNRRANKNHTKALVKNMTNGTWRYNGDPIRFDANGTLIDGQHRLMAVVDSGATLPFKFIYGLDPECVKNIDMDEKRRNLNDLFAMDGIKQSTTTASVVGRYFVFLNGNTGLTNSAQQNYGMTMPTIEQQYDFYYTNEEIITEVVRYARKLNSANPLLFTPTELGAMFLFLVLGKNHPFETVKGFFDSVFYSSPLTVINELRNKLVIDRSKNTQKRMIGSVRQSYIAKAWNYYLKGRDVKVLQYNMEKEGKIQFN